MNIICCSYSKMAAYVRRVQNKFCFTIILYCFAVPTALSANIPLDNNAKIDGLNPRFKPLQPLAGDGQIAGQPGQRINQQAEQPVHVAQQGAAKAADHDRPMRKGIMLATHPDCQEDVARFCDTQAMRKNNFAVLECLQSDTGLEEKVSEKCQHLVYTYKQNLTKDDRFESGANEVCKEVLDQFPDCKNLPIGSGQRIPCLIEELDNITDKECVRFLHKMAGIVFSDYRLVFHFMEHCKPDIEQFKCGRLETAENKMHSQGQVIMCLAQNIGDLQAVCKKQVLRVAELQADDYHLDRPLYYACRDAREHFCDSVHAGDGKVFQCLYKHKMDEAMPEKCRDLLRVRQQMMAEDVKVEKTFYDACAKDMRAYQCMSQDQSLDGHTARSTVLLCLEGAMKKEQQVSHACIAEMQQLRRFLMEDYQITPEIVCNCGKEIENFCSDNGALGTNGGTVHCLIQSVNQHQRQRGKNRNHPDDAFSPKCKAEIENLLKEADVAQDVSVDQVLMHACSNVIADCTGDKTDMMNCLMEKVDSNEMTETCEDRLLEIQYFIVRDFRLDPHLYKACHKDAQELCHASGTWADVNGPPTAEIDPHVFPCLYRHLPYKIQQMQDKMREENEQVQELQLRPLTGMCEHEVKRTMKHRARNIDLEPEIEQACLVDLGALCSDLDHYGRGEELRCLQDNYEDIGQEDCRELMKEFIQDEDEDLDLDAILMRSCTPMIKEYCGDLLKHSNDATDVMDCLIESKNDPGMDPKCKAGIEHHQIIQLKDFSFNHEFKQSCKNDVMEHCKGGKTKAEIVACLSEIVRDDVLTEAESRISVTCRKQLRVEVLRMSEDIHLDPKLEESCGEDITKFCKLKKAGNAEVIECLKDHMRKLSDKCHKKLFAKEVNEAVQGGDFTVFRTCKQMIKTFCTHKEPKDVVKCLKNHMNSDGFDDKCRGVILKRAMEDTKDYRLNPSLVKSCRLDIPKFCSDVLASAKIDEEYEGRIINCLKKRFIKKDLSMDCRQEIKSMVRDTHLDINMDPVVMHACEHEIRTYCNIGEHEEVGGNLKFHPNDDTGDKVKNCLEEKMLEGKIDTKTPCGREISRIIEEVQIDVHIDPQLNAACTQDLVRHCREYESGFGQKMSCLLQTYEDIPNQMNPNCAKMLENRKMLWEYAAKIAPPETFSEIHSQIMQSPAKNYLLGVIMTIIGVIFIVGITCGRVTKRVTQEQKNK